MSLSTSKPDADRWVVRFCTCPVEVESAAKGDWFVTPNHHRLPPSSLAPPAVDLTRHVEDAGVDAS